MKKVSVLFIPLLAILLIGGCSTQPKTGWDMLPEILAQIKPPTFPDKDFPVTDYGAIGDGETDCTEAFKMAIAACNEAGGGRVIVPEGTFLTGAIHLKSNVNLHLSQNSTILFTHDLKKYLPVVLTRFESTECMNYSPFIYAFEQENIAITGKGTLDGQADTTAWWPWKGRPSTGWKPGMLDPNKDVAELRRMAEEGVPVEQRVFGEGHALRVNFIQPYRCKNVLIEGVKVVRSPMWEINPVLCENVTVKDVTVISHGPNNDGCNPECSKNVLITGCYFDTGDDCIAIKSGRNADGRRVNVPSENIVVQNCRMKDGHGGVVLGSETSGGIRNVFAENCEMDSPNLDRALRIKTNSVRGGVIENVYMRNIKIGQVADAVLRVNFQYQEGDAGEFTPVVRNVHMENVTCNKSRYGVRLAGYADSPVSDIYLKDCTFDTVEIPLALEHYRNLVLDNVRLSPK